MLTPGKKSELPKEAKMTKPRSKEYGILSGVRGARFPDLYLNFRASRIFGRLIDEAEIDLPEVKEWTEAYSEVQGGKSKDRRCRECDKALPAEAVYCPGCGSPC